MLYLVLFRTTLYEHSDNGRSISERQGSHTRAVNIFIICLKKVTNFEKLMP